MAFATRVFGTAIIVFACSGLGSAAFADNEFKDYPNPVYKGHLLDWCKSWAAECGKPAADAFCVKNGYEQAAIFVKKENPGQSTRVIGSNQVCDEEECDGFAKIRCVKTVDSGDSEAEEVTYSKPKYKGKRLDWCKTWAVDCGKPAADAFCEYKGHATATDFKFAENIGLTRIIKTGQTCDNPDCDGFKFITCSDEE